MRVQTLFWKSIIISVGDSYDREMSGPCQCAKNINNQRSDRSLPELAASDPMGLATRHQHPESAGGIDPTNEALERENSVIKDDNSDEHVEGRKRGISRKTGRRGEKRGSEADANDNNKNFQKQKAGSAGSDGENNVGVTNTQSQQTNNHPSATANKHSQSQQKFDAEKFEAHPEQEPAHVHGELPHGPTKRSSYSDPPPPSLQTPFVHPLRKNLPHSAQERLEWELLARDWSIHGEFLRHTWDEFWSPDGADSGGVLESLPELTAADVVRGKSFNGGEYPNGGGQQIKNGKLGPQLQWWGVVAVVFCLVFAASVGLLLILIIVEKVLTIWRRLAHRSLAAKRQAWLAVNQAKRKRQKRRTSSSGAGKKSNSQTQTHNAVRQRHMANPAQERDNLSTDRGESSPDPVPESLNVETKVHRNRCRGGHRRKLSKVTNGIDRRHESVDETRLGGTAGKESVQQRGREEETGLQTEPDAVSVPGGPEPLSVRRKQWIPVACDALSENMVTRTLVDSEETVSEENATEDRSPHTTGHEPD